MSIIITTMIVVKGTSDDTHLADDSVSLGKMLQAVPVMHRRSKKSVE